jgi:glycosyltransferase involved in cell wall biosynthesis
VLPRVRPFVENILVVDDGSTDGTGRLLGEMDFIDIVRHCHNCGYGRSLADAFNYAICNRYDWVITMDADGQHEPDFIPHFLAAAAADDCDIVSGSRYLGEGASIPPPDRRAINHEITDLLNRTLELKLTDAFCGFKAYRVQALRLLHITEPGYAMPLQVWTQAVRRGLRIREIPVRLLYLDQNRSFGGRLDDSQFRRRHYIEVLRRSLEEEGFPTCEIVQTLGQVCP